MNRNFIKTVVGICLFTLPVSAFAQEQIPDDNGLSTYHSSPRYRESESHPLRILGYALHPIGWLAREVVFRPLSYFASSTEVTRSVMGYREPFDYRKPECFSADDSVPDCRSVSPFNYDNLPGGEHGNGAGATDTASLSTGGTHVYFPDVNFDFNKHALNDLGKGRVRQISQLLKSNPNLTIVLEGNADYIGSEQYNQKLGMDRAEAVRAELVSMGVDAPRLSTVSFGESQPVFAEEADWARAVNRRVSVKNGDEGSDKKAMWMPAE